MKNYSINNSTIDNVSSEWGAKFRVDILIDSNDNKPAQLYCSVYGETKDEAHSKALAMCTILKLSQSL